MPRSDLFRRDRKKATDAIFPLPGAPSLLRLQHDGEWRPTTEVTFERSDLADSITADEVRVVRGRRGTGGCGRWTREKLSVG